MWSHSRRASVSLGTAKLKQSIQSTGCWQRAIKVVKVKSIDFWNQRTVLAQQSLDQNILSFPQDGSSGRRASLSHSLHSRGYHLYYLPTTNQKTNLKPKCSTTSAQPPSKKPCSKSECRYNRSRPHWPSPQLGPVLTPQRKPHFNR